VSGTTALPILSLGKLAASTECPRPLQRVRAQAVSRWVDGLRWRRHSPQLHRLNILSQREQVRSPNRQQAPRTLSVNYRILQHAPNVRSAAERCFGLGRLTRLERCDGVHPCIAAQPLSHELHQPARPTRHVLRLPPATREQPNQVCKLGDRAGLERAVDELQGLTAPLQPLGAGQADDADR
jgi:hypothetical protein